MMYRSAFGNAISYMQYIYVAAKNEDPFCFSGYLAFLKNKLEIDKMQIRDLVSI